MESALAICSIVGLGTPQFPSRHLIGGKNARLEN
jgi:hypothetical protein